MGFTVKELCFDIYISLVGSICDTARCNTRNCHILRFNNHIILGQTQY